MRTRVALGCALALLALASSAEPLWAKNSSKRYVRSLERYEVPDVTLVDQEGQAVRLREALGPGTPVALDFVYASCTTICPVLSAGFSSLQRRLGEQPVRLVSITIDPEYDTPEVLAAYLERYRAMPGWDFLTGSREDIDAVMQAFDAYVPNKMAHYPLTFFRTPDGGWVRIYGLIGTRELLEEYQQAAPP